MRGLKRFLLSLVAAGATLFPFCGQLWADTSSHLNDLDPEVIDAWVHRYGPRDFSRSEYPHFSRPNGCGPEFLENFSMGIFLTHIMDRVSLVAEDGSRSVMPVEEVCNAHDRCYMNRNKTKSECDKEFGMLLANKCLQIETKYKSACHRVRELYLTTVKKMGQEIWNKSQAEQKRFDEFIESSFIEIRAYAVNKLPNKIRGGFWAMSRRIPDRKEENKKNLPQSRPRSHGIR
ncbi:MAG: hypothetical protein KDD35_10795 [Bdellovibrionales bacterium]|nr:hypothetical protein [Bdellovibrionales bacterium]